MQNGERMIINTKWFGEIETEESKIFTFENGIIGFSDFKKYAIVGDSEKENGGNILWLQSLDEVSLAIPIVNPIIIKQDYDPLIEDELLKSIDANYQNADIDVFVTLTVPADITKMTANLKAPIIFDNDTMKGIQLIADNDDYPVKFEIYDILKANQNRKEGE